MEELSYRLPFLGDERPDFFPDSDLGLWIKAAWDYRDAYFELVGQKG